MILYELITAKKFSNFAWRKGTVDQWDSYWSSLNDGYWYEETDGMSVSEKIYFLNSKMEKASIENFQNLVTRKNIERKKIPKEIQALFKKI